MTEVGAIVGRWISPLYEECQRDCVEVVLDAGHKEQAANRIVPNPSGGRETLHPADKCLGIRLRDSTPQSGVGLPQPVRKLGLLIGFCSFA